MHHGWNNGKAHSIHAHKALLRWPSMVRFWDLYWIFEKRSMFNQDYNTCDIRLCRSNCLIDTLVRCTWDRKWTHFALALVKHLASGCLLFLPSSMSGGVLEPHVNHVTNRPALVVPHQLRILLDALWVWCQYIVKYYKIKQLTVLWTTAGILRLWPDILWLMSRWLSTNLVTNAYIMCQKETAWSGRNWLVGPWICSNPNQELLIGCIRHTDVQEIRMSHYFNLHSASYSDLPRIIFIIFHTAFTSIFLVWHIEPSSITIFTFNHVEFQDFSPYPSRLSFLIGPIWLVKRFCLFSLDYPLLTSKSSHCEPLQSLSSISSSSFAPSRSANTVS